LFKELFCREGFDYDNIFDWTVLDLQQERIRLPAAEQPLDVNDSVGATQDEAGNDTGDA
jgi:casein kinase 1